MRVSSGRPAAASVGITAASPHGGLMQQRVQGREGQEAGAGKNVESTLSRAAEQERVEQVGGGEAHPETAT